MARVSDKSLHGCLEPGVTRCGVGLAIGLNVLYVSEGRAIVKPDLVKGLIPRLARCALWQIGNDSSRLALAARRDANASSHVLFNMAALGDGRHVDLPPGALVLSKGVHRRPQAEHHLDAGIIVGGDKRLLDINVSQHVPLNIGS